ncbi:hypothetical protein COU19_01620 [Candidatus Kaiserbacteria bacterium CG10_big_fil_rev_8_21_14_0_10_56_12]|uniref:ComEC/Rec2-related protein domain-containing protein n=1 Tax=Candidatus Kaiserbacteria bacterium CG10_big_fil_rev_8_21_14_0_10_56_12 TaxID=1974611 RepID=A0A2H0U9U5_9BACT|nr:MAG: hypothetical protein COU19_01620 [Candidatus Kaiserbacteria bacterium CG10_big_fil_rev_8_21_14_0_10_56_12]
MPWLLSLVVGFASGVFLQSVNGFGWEPVVFVLLLAGLFGGAALRAPRLGYTLGAVFCLLCALGMARTSLADAPLPDTFRADLRHRATYDGTVIQDPDLRETTQRVQVRVHKGAEETAVLVVAKRYPEVSVGDRVRVTGTLLTPTPFDTDGGRVFRYDKYLAKDGVRFLMNFATIRVEARAPWYSLSAALARIKHGFLRGLSATLPTQSAALAGGVVIGGKTGLNKELQNAFIQSGLVHVIVLSGYNVMIVAEWVMALLALVTRSRHMRGVAGALALLLFVGIAGFSATALRATLMALIALYARATGRNYAASRSLLAAIFIMLIWNPLYLVFDPGFGLSITATAGLIWLSPLFSQALVRLRERLHRRAVNKVQAFGIEAMSTTLAAQTGVLPLLLYNTGNLSIVALPANLLVIAVMPLAMAAAGVAGVFGSFFASTVPLVAHVVALPASVLTRYVMLVAETSAALPGAALTIPAFSFGWVLTAYAALVFIASSKRFSMTPQLQLAKKASM